MNDKLPCCETCRNSCGSSDILYCCKVHRNVTPYEGCVMYEAKECIADENN